MLRIAPHEVLARAPIEPPWAFQRRAARTLDQIIDLSPALRLGASPVHPIDLLRAELIRRVGDTLAAFELVREAATLPEADDGVVLTPRFPSLPLYRAAACYRRASGQEVYVEPGLAHHRERVRVRAYRLRAQAEWLAALPQTEPLGARPDAVLLAVQQPGHVQDVAPLLPRLQDAGAAVRVVAGDLRPVMAGERQGIPVELLPVSAAARSRAMVRAVQVRRRVAQLLRRTPMARLGGRSFAALVGGTVDHVLATHLHRIAGREVALATALASSSVVVLPNPYTDFGRLVGGLARRRGVPVVAFQHGNVFHDDPKWARISADVVCAWGAPSATALVSCGVDPSTIVVTGSPRSDSFRGGPPRPTTSHGAVLVATSGPGDRVSAEQHELFVGELARAVDRTPDVRWTIKLHPKDRVEYYSAVRGAQIIPPDHSRLTIYDHLADVDVMVTIASTAAVDAVTVGVPVVLFEVKGSTDATHEPLVSNASKVVVSTGDELASAVRRTVADPVPTADPDYLDRHFANAGHALDSIVDAILSARR
jgi:hypothetical protein